MAKQPVGHRHAANTRSGSVGECERERALDVTREFKKSRGEDPKIVYHLPVSAVSVECRYYAVLVNYM